jgi:hypothetical protein
MAKIMRIREDNFTNPPSFIGFEKCPFGVR